MERMTREYDLLEKKKARKRVTTQMKRVCGGFPSSRNEEGRNDKPNHPRTVHD